MISSRGTTSVSNFVMVQSLKLEDRLRLVLCEDGGRKILGNLARVDNIHAYNGMSGYNYWIESDLVAQLYIGTLVSGTYVIYKRTYINFEVKESYDYYDPEGVFFYESATLDGQCLTYNSISMDPTNPFINHIYNILHSEYQGTTFNYGNTARIKYLESLLNIFYNDTQVQLSVNSRLNDQSFKDISKEIISIENDSILKWSERQTIFKQLKQVRAKVLSTKRRVHNYNYMLYDFIIMLYDVKLKFKTFKQRPLNNFIGSLYRHTLGNFFWFVGTVKSNLGYSVALAIYGPFTFYFITQPMNPHAMWAVGKLRNTYIQITRVFTPTKGRASLIATTSPKEDHSNQDDLTSTQSSVQKEAPLIMPIKHISWKDRMSNFKAMQISYEEAMVFSERMGRVEQFETQFNFPLTAEAAWMEMELYLESIDGTLKYFKNLDARYTGFLNKEKKRTLELQLYIWKKMGQFFIDHPYIVVDEESEQTERNYYLGRQFIFFNKMTEKLTKLGLASSAHTHKDIRKLARKFSKMKISGNSVLDTLKKNSKIFQQENFLSSSEHREYMKRQWEILFMQQNKKQEASSFSLQTYTWSIKNAIWLLQTIYSAKRNELAVMTGKYNLNNTSSTKDEKASPVMNEYLENMFNNLTTEFVSIRKEMVSSLPGDSEARLRQQVINNIKSYLVDRDKLFNTGIYASSHNTKKNSI